MLNNEINGRYKQLMASMNKDVPDFVTEVKGTPAKYYRILRGEVKPNFDTLFELMEGILTMQIAKVDVYQDSDGGGRSGV